MGAPFSTTFFLSLPLYPNKTEEVIKMRSKGRRSIMKLYAF